MNSGLEFATKLKPHISFLTRERCTSLNRERDNSRVPQRRLDSRPQSIMGIECLISRMVSLTVDCRGVNISLTKAIWKFSNDKNVRYFVKTAYFIEEENDEDEITHAVPFKCIGAAHEKNYQHHLEQAYLALHGQDINQ